jgi:hypothetical protein
MSMENHGGMISTPELSGSHTSSHLAANQRNMGKESRHWPSKYLYSHFEVILMPQNLQHGADGFTFPPNEVLLRICIALKTPLP